jgi:hypothetical protein
LQSLNSEDAVTWSTFGNLVYLIPPERLVFVNRLLDAIGEPPVADPPTCWLWRRLPHPEKPESSGGPEIDFAFLTSSTLVLGEAKWNSPLGGGQGIDGNRTQLDLRIQYCEKYAPRALPSVHRFIVLGVGRTANVFDGAELRLDTPIKIRALTWNRVVDCCDSEFRDELRMYLGWKETQGS